MILPKNKFSLAIVFGLILSTGAAQAATNSVVISMQDLTQLSDFAQTASQNFNKLQAEKGTQIQKRGKKYEDNKKALEASAKVKDASLIFKESEELEAERVALEALAEAFKGEMQRAGGRVMSQISELLRAALEDYASTSGWDIVFLKETGEIIYCSEKANVSKIIATKMDEIHNKNTNAKPTMPNDKAKPAANKPNNKK